MFDDASYGILLSEYDKFNFSGDRGSVPWVFLRCVLPCTVVVVQI